jgi:prevent-host-death family protein
MDKAVSAADANRLFSELLRMVKKGRSVVVTSHGKAGGENHASRRA